MHFSVISRPLARYALLGLLATIIGLFFSVQVYLLYSREKWTSWPRVLILNVPEWWLWAIFSVLIWRLAKRVSIEEQSRGYAFAKHLGLSIAVSLMHLLLTVTIVWTILHRSEPKLTWTNMLWRNFLFMFPWEIITYWGILAVCYAVNYYRSSKEEALRAAQLEQQLAQAQLQALRMQLRPHFLFNTLQSISSLMHRDVDAADRMLAQLGQLLRLHLTSSDAQEIPLREELRLVRQYLDIEQIRFRDRLTVHLSIAPDALDALVPNLLLQPLVENAIRHGIDSLVADGRIEVIGFREDSHLCLEVRDNGPGLSGAAATALHKGLGLSNTRLRLERLYGPRASLLLRTARDRGLSVILKLPYQETAEHAEVSLRTS